MRFDAEDTLKGLRDEVVYEGRRRLTGDEVAAPSGVGHVHEGEDDAPHRRGVGLFAVAPGSVGPYRRDDAGVER